MPKYQVVAYDRTTRAESTHLDVHAHDAMTAALAICGGPLIEATEGARAHQLRARVAPMSNPVDLRFFYLPPKSAAELRLATSGEKSGMIHTVILNGIYLRIFWRMAGRWRQRS